MAAFVAACLVAPRPGAGITLMLAMEMVDADLRDKPFHDRCYIAFASFRGYRDVERDGIPESAGWAAHTVSVVADEMRKRVPAIATRRIFIAVAWALQRTHHREQPLWATLMCQPWARLHGQPDRGEDSRATKVELRGQPWMRAQGATDRDIFEGDIVLARNQRGSCLAGMVVTEDLARGAVQLATGARSHTDDLISLRVDGNPNDLTPDIGRPRLEQGPCALTAAVVLKPCKRPAPAVRAYDPPEFTGHP